MLAAINANSLDDFTIDKWLDNNGDCDDLDLLRSDLALLSCAYARRHFTKWHLVGDSVGLQGQKIMN